MAFPTYEYITLDAILANVKVMMRMDTNGNAEDMYLLKHIKTCVEAMCTKNQYQEKPAILPIDCFTAELPCDFVKFDRPCPLLFLDGDCGWFTATYTGGPLFNCTTNLANAELGVPVVEVSDGKLHFSNNIFATKCQISYLGLVWGEDGELKIPISHLRAIENGTCYHYLRSLEKQPWVYADYKQIWTDGKFDQRGQENMLNSFEQQQLSRTMNSMFPTKYLY